MKAILVGILALGSTSVSAQNLTKAEIATLLQGRKATLEAVNPGMSKIAVTTSAVVLPDGTKCDFRQTAVQSILKIEAEKMIVLSKETFRPAVSAACTAAGVEAFEESILFYAAKPTLAQDLKDLEASDVKSASRIGEAITMTISGTLTNDDGTTRTELMTIKYDLAKSSFKNIILSQSPSLKTETSDMADIDVAMVNLTDVVFCENNDGGKEDCVRGDFSDILF